MMKKFLVISTCLLTFVGLAEINLHSPVGLALFGRPILQSSNPNLFTWWKLNGDGEDSGTNGFNLFPTGTVTYTNGENGVNPGAFVGVNGSSIYLSMTNVALQNICSNSFTVTCWFYELSSIQYARIFTIGWNPNGNLFETYILADRGSQHLGISTPTTNYVNQTMTVTYTHPLDKWVFVAARWDAVSNIASIYINSTNFFMANYSSGIGSPTNNNFIVGSDSTQPSNNFNGYIDDVRIYPFLLTSNQITLINVAGADNPSP